MMTLRMVDYYFTNLIIDSNIFVAHPDFGCYITPADFVLTVVGYTKKPTVYL
jgi:hypothetical protein